MRAAVSLALVSFALAAPPTLPPAQQVSAQRATLLRTAEDGLRTTKENWWDARLGWWDDHLNDTDRLPLASLWQAYPLFEATSAVAIADPSPARRAAVASFAAGAEKYWDPTLKPSGGYAYYPTARGWNAYFDDNGWWGLAFLDAYAATGTKRYLADARRALRYIDDAGWDPVAGGTWWDAAHHHKTSEPLAAAAVIAAKLYRLQHHAADLRLAKRYIAWADAHTWDRKTQLYGRSATDDTVMDYVEGMMAAAHEELCMATRVRAYCTKAEQLLRASLATFPVDADWAPQYDTVYLRWVLDVYANDHERDWYALVYRNATRALAHARDANDPLWLRRWDGTYATTGALAVQAATLALFAWTAAVPPPA